MTTDTPRWRDTRALIRSDYDRFRPLMTGMSLPKRLFWCLLPQFQGLVMHRIARHLYLHDRKRIAGLIYLVAAYLTWIDILPSTDLGAGCWLGHPPIILRGRIGSGLVCLGANGILGDGAGAEIGGDGPRLPWVGDNVSLALDAAIVGAVSIGDNVRFAPRALVTVDVGHGAFVAAPSSRVMTDAHRTAGSGAGGPVAHAETPTTTNRPATVEQPTPTAHLPLASGSVALAADRPPPDIRPERAMTRIDPPLNWFATRGLIRSDFQRLLPLMNGPTLAKKMFWFMLPPFQGLLLYRLSRHLYLAGWRNSANLLHLFSLYVTKIDIPPRTALGGSCLLGHPPIVLCGRIGERFTFNGVGGIGGGFGSEDIGGGAGLPVIGDNVTVAFKASVLGPVRVGDNTRVGPGALVTRDVPAGSLVLWDRPRVIRGEPAPAAPAAAAVEEAGALP